MRTLLHEGWSVTVAGGTGRAEVPDRIADAVIPAEVPGCVHTDLLTAGLIPDPYLDEHEAALAWIGRVDWRYRTSFQWTPTAGLDRVDLVCDGLDTVAGLTLNGVEIGTARNMHRGHRFDLRQALRDGDNELVVTFKSAVDYANEMRERLGARIHVMRYPFNMVRKMACNFGWDWGPELVTAGIWQPIALHEWSSGRLAGVRPLATVDGSVGRVAVHVDLARAEGRSAPLAVTARVGEHRATTMLGDGPASTTVDVEVPEPRLWWPHGYGAAERYPVEVTLHDPASSEDIVDSWRGAIGFRTVRWDTEPDEHGTPLRLYVNEVPVFVRGVNWIPDDCFPHRVDRARYRARLTDARAAGANLLRVWGGGIYEREDFYDLADELGLLTWQDFLFACAAYPEEEPLRGEVIAEAREAVSRLAAHPSLVLWNGSNENIWGHFDWGWREQLGERTWGIGYYLDVLPAIVSELDPTRTYLPSSPWSMTMDIHPNDPNHGCTHVWDVWNERDYLGYRDSVPRFVAEFGFQGAPTWTTMTSAVHDEPLAPDSTGVLAHQKAEHGPAKIAARLAEHFPPQRTFEDWLLATQLNQARAIRLGIEHFRSWSPRCAGTVLWQLNDCWPVTSWAVVDGDGRRKPAWYALRRAFADRLITVQPRGDSLAVVLVNEHSEPWPTGIRVARRSFSGTVLAEVDTDVLVDARRTATIVIPSEVATPGDAGTELITATAKDSTVDRAIVERALWFFAADRELVLPAAQWSASAMAADGGYRIDVTAGSLVRELAPLVDMVAADATVDEMLVTLLPGESTSFVVRTDAVVDPARLIDPTVLRCANQLC
jgi:beta-mannosidase